MRQGELAPYMTWAKLRPPPRYDLAGSNLLACPLEELPGLDSLEPGGANSEGWAPLVERIASRYGVTPAQVATGGGCSGANLLAFAAVVEPGDEVVVERPGYDPLLGALELIGARITRFERRREDRWAIDPDRVQSAARSLRRCAHCRSSAFAPTERGSRGATRCPHWSAGTTHIVLGV